MAAEGQSMANTKVSPFNGPGPNQPLAASHSIQNATIAAGSKAKQQLELGAPPINARNLNVQSVMAESSNVIESGHPQNGPNQVNLRKTFNVGLQG